LRKRFEASWIWVVFAGIFAVQIYKAWIFDGDGTAPLASGVIASRVAALDLGGSAFLHLEARLGRKGVQYFPIVTDLAGPLLWAAVAVLHVRWRRIANVALATGGPRGFESDGKGRKRRKDE
jgi:hypothetical protein